MQQIIKKNRTEGKIKSHYGMRDYYKNYISCEKSIKIESKKYNKIIDTFNKELINLIIEDNIEYFVPYLGVSFSVKKVKQVPKILNGKLYNTAPVDWVATNKLWSEDMEAYEKKLLVKYNNNHTMKYIFRVYMKKNVTPIFNKRYYSFKSSRGFSRKLSKRINDETKENYDSFLLYKQKQ